MHFHLKKLRDLIVVLCNMRSVVYHKYFDFIFMVILVSIFRTFLARDSFVIAINKFYFISISQNLDIVRIAPAINCSSDRD